ncbi:hypothetical protein EC988_005628, partial [Linderina pennispora]
NSVAPHHHSLPAIDINGQSAVTYQGSYGLADGTTNMAASLMQSQTQWGPAPATPLSPHNTTTAVAVAAAQQHSPQSWYGQMYGQPQYSPTGHQMVMYHEGYATSPSAMAAAAAYYPPRARLTTTLWEDEQTLVYQVDCRGICVARRHDDNTINGTKLLNVVGMSRGKRDGILKNEKGRRVVKVGPMHLKGVWIPFERARFLAEQFKIVDVLFPIFQPDPNSYLYGTIPMNSPSSAAGLPTQDGYTAGYTAAATPTARAPDAYEQPAAASQPAAVTATGPPAVSHTYSASLSQVVSGTQLHHPQPQHHHSSSSSVSGPVTQGLGINYSGRLAGMPSSPPPAMSTSTSATHLAGMVGGPVSPSSSYTDKKGSRYAPYGGGSFQATPGVKRGSIDYHHQMHTPLNSAPAPVDEAKDASVGVSAASSSTYFESLVTKTEQ